MAKIFRSLFWFVLITGCIEPYEFVVHDDAPSLVVEAMISDKSFNETLAYPSDGRYFTVRLSETGDVSNLRARPVENATVELLTSKGEVLIYTETGEGLYTLHVDDFKALPGVEYRIRVALKNDRVYESAWEGLPTANVPSIGDIGFREIEKQVYVMEAGTWKLRTRQFLSAYINVPENSVNKEIFYRWTYSPMWIYIAPLVSRNSPGSTCWVTDPYYLNKYDLQVDRTGGYPKDLFEIQTIRNERIFEKFSVLVTQQAMSEGFYNFWKEMKDRNESGALSGTPPFNLQSNFTSVDAGQRVSGYFGVTAEDATRWYFDRSELSYEVTNTLMGDCLVVYGPGPPAEECLNCTAYSFGDATTTKPAWWQ